MIYTYCGIKFKTNEIFPFFDESTGDTPICVKVVSEQEDLQKSEFIFKRNEVYYVNFSPIGYYEIAYNSIICHFEDREFVKATICNIPFAIFLILHEILPIHCSSVSMQSRNEAMLFVGRKGMGKTTIAYLLNQLLGYNLLGDDVAGIEKDGENLVLYCGTKQVKLCEDFWDSENILDEKKEVYNNWKKFYYTPKLTANRAEKYIVSTLFLLGRGKALETTLLKNFNKAYILNNIVGINYIGEILSKEIINIINKYIITETKLEVRRLYTPNGINNLKQALIKFKDMEKEIEYNKGEGLIEKIF